MAVFNLRDISDDLAHQVRVEAAKRAMTLPQYVVECVKIRLGLPVSEDGEKTAKKFARKVKAGDSPKEIAAKAGGRKQHDSETCRVYGCGMCRAAGVKDKKRGL